MPWYLNPIPTPCADSIAAAEQRQAQLTKPAGALGRLESLAIWLAGCQGRPLPELEQFRIVVFAADHGIAAEGVSAFPQAVTAEMIRNFSRGGAAVNVLALQLGANLEVVNVGTVTEVEALNGVVDTRIAAGTANFAIGPSMTSEQCEAALAAGQQAVERMDNRHGLFIGGEMGIGNTSAATAIGCRLLGLPAAELVGAGTGLDSAGIAHKTQLIQQALDLHGLACLNDSGNNDSGNNPDSAFETLCCVGGFEIAALAGAYIAAAQAGQPSLIDGFITTAAALVAVRLNPSLRPWLAFAHGSAEPGHRHLLAALNAEPLLNLELRLGEASGAASAAALLQQACALHSQMATFADAAVSEKLP